MPQVQYFIHAGGPQYAPPLLRAPSPASSIGTEYAEDLTDLVDRELSQEELQMKCEEKIGLHQPRMDEMAAAGDILLRPRPRNTAAEIELHKDVMRHLRERVKQLEEDELFEQTMLRGTQIGQEQLPTSDDVDVIMKSLMEMGPSLSKTTATQMQTSTDPQPETAATPWNALAILPKPSQAGSPGPSATPVLIGRRPTRLRPKERR
ncbi:hypothetical protein WOLCODRAFT_143017 [Wolfiporia cocos MD-104 SS10]|uniref:Uncharacterized protein n=1 Tax=Wolfiporia cocos (strain MD-104) TaxID=742152 RepID=A0A2H3JDG5_WOLCO|nr:hypothetical protein WOLCODRAFT_143017 [Wolfiporia cocos MD-104 SS10]